MIGWMVKGKKERKGVYICDAAHEKVPNRPKGVISMVVQTYQGIKKIIQKF